MSTLRVNNIQNASGGTNTSLGKVLKVVYATTGFNRQTINSSTPVAVSGLSVSITPTSATNKILIMGNLRGTYTYVASLTLYRNGSPTISNHGGNSSSGIADVTLYNGNNNAGLMRSSSFLFQDAPGSTSTQTYQIYACSVWPGAQPNFFINDRNSTDMLSQSHICAMEIVG